MVPPPPSAEAAFATYTRNTTAGMRVEELKTLLGDLGLLQVGVAGFGLYPHGWGRTPVLAVRRRLLTLATSTLQCGPPPCRAVPRQRPLPLWPRSLQPPTGAPRMGGSMPKSLLPTIAR